MVILMNSRGNQRKSFCNHEINSDGDFHRFMSDISKNGFSSFTIKTAVHRARNIALCGRHRFSRIFSMRKFPAFSHLNHNNIMLANTCNNRDYNMLPITFHLSYSKPIILLFKLIPILSACIVSNADCAKTSRIIVFMFLLSNDSADIKSYTS